MSHEGELLSKQWFLELERGALELEQGALELE
jgi:hypothetical protein